MRSGQPRRREGIGIVLAALSGAVLAAVACDQSSGGSSTSPGNTVVNDTRDAEVRAPENPSDGAAPNGEPDGYAVGQPDASYGEAGYVTYEDGGAPAAYPGVSECSTCSCPAATAYCFGGATARKEPMIRPEGAGDAGNAGDAGDAGLCPLVPPGSLGCTALPAGDTDCASIIVSLQPTYGCYLVCANDGKQMTVYCPNP